MSTSLEIVSALPRGARFHRADLHIHSFGGSHDVKDASMTPDGIVRQALAEGLDVIAVADHNEVINVQATVNAAEGHDLLVVPAVELSTSQGHLLCYAPTVDALTRFHAQLSLADRGTQNSRCQTALLQCLTLLEQLGGFAGLAHVDAPGGFEAAEPKPSTHKADVLCHRALLGIELKNASSQISYSPERSVRTQIKERLLEAAEIVRKAGPAIGARLRELADPDAISLGVNEFRSILQAVDGFESGAGADAYDAQQRTRVLRRLRQRAGALGFDLINRGTGEVLAAAVS